MINLDSGCFSELFFVQKDMQGQINTYIYIFFLPESLVLMVTWILELNRKSFAILARRNRFTNDVKIK